MLYTVKVVSVYQSTLNRRLYWVIVFFVEGWRGLTIPSPMTEDGESLFHNLIERILGKTIPRPTGDRPFDMADLVGHSVEGQSLREWRCSYTELFARKQHVKRGYKF